MCCDVGGVGLPPGMELGVCWEVNGPLGVVYRYNYGFEILVGFIDLFVIASFSPRHRLCGIKKLSM